MHLAQQHAHDRLAQVVTPGEQVPEAVRQRQDPLSHRYVCQHVVHQMRRALGHAPPAAARAEPPALARERDQALGLAPNALEPRKTASEEAARQERLELRLDKTRHALAVAEVRGLGEKRLQVLA